MRTDVHFAALKAAAKVAFSMALLNGCASIEQNDDETASDESAVNAKKPRPYEADASPAKPSCDAVLASAFPSGSETTFEPFPVSKEVAACCDAELMENTFTSPYRWQCCFAYDPEATPNPTGWGNGNHTMACTPWGPPVPPSMNRKLRAVA